MYKPAGHSLIIALVLLSLTAVCCCGLDGVLQMVAGDATVCVSSSETLKNDSHCGEHDDHLIGEVRLSRQDATAALDVAAPSELVLWAASTLPIPPRSSLDSRLRLSSPPCERITPLLI